MSHCAMAAVPARMAVSAPIHITQLWVAGAWVKIASVRAIMYTPAVTIVAAWISAETGVGPAIASGSQTNSGTCADLPVAPIKSRNEMPTVTGMRCQVGPNILPRISGTRSMKPGMVSPPICSV